jgi:archaellum component FlaG (FlaF/FlaG flagellin family)
MVQLFISRVVITAAEASRQAQNKETLMQSLLDESERVKQAISENSRDPDSPSLPEADRLELYALADEIQQLLGQMKKDNETP